MAPSLTPAYLILFLMLLSGQYLLAQTDSETISWKKIGDDLELAVIHASESNIFATDMYLLRTSLKRFDLAVIRAEEFQKSRMTAKQLCLASKSYVCINANFFDKNAQTLGLVVQQGIVQNKMHRGGKTLTGIFYTGRTSPHIVSRSSLPESGVLHAVQAGPRLIEDGKPIVGFKENHNASRRSGVCIDKKDRIVFFASSAGITGVPLFELQQLLLSDTLGCRDAINLDGGGSTQLYISPDIPGAATSFKGLTIPGRDRVPVALALK